MNQSTIPFWQSKTLWVNIIATAALFAQSHYGFVASPELQAYGLMAVNTLLRIITKKEVTLS